VVLNNLKGAIYIGDGIYAKWLNQQEFALLTSDGIRITNSIVFDLYNFQHVISFVSERPDLNSIPSACEPEVEDATKSNE
jgi:endonuclease V-like protein UPF0215 family